MNVDDNQTNEQQMNTDVTARGDNDNHDMDELLYGGNVSSDHLKSLDEIDITDEEDDDIMN
eukprot:CAMPEP_0201586220 /NCGR_PEP_ID=MMETSP0190_2-20130828/130343_1 /ASSEMBLY_ACC=CAM_ASM_000263 /TAXON_ID=37353 /ORGANISM="Rosalina sp." /LENGTH=60 /DNA_ID=CAMNT_0048033765 /DNA_START=21 /DNA_END=200 /DNA_ORIENTATION=+